MNAIELHGSEKTSKIHWIFLRYNVSCKHNCMYPNNTINFQQLERTNNTKLSMKVFAFNRGLKVCLENKFEKH